jgi:exosortase E/protease (VPEID-CTERM system)
VNEISSRVIIPIPKLNLAARLVILGAIFFFEKLLLDGFVDSQAAQSASGLGGFVRIAQHWVFRFLVAMGAALAIFAFVSGEAQRIVAAARVQASGLRVSWVLVHFLLIACLIPVSSFLYDSSLPFSAMFALWMMLGIGAMFSAFLAMASGPIWLSAARSLGIVWCYAAIAALLGVGVMQLSQTLWQPTAALTFNLVRLLLLPAFPTLSADAATRVLSTDRFAVEVSQVCSGLEGMGLILAFSAAWLLYFRHEYIFPRAVLLIPAGLVAMFALNVVRIATLVVIGSAGFPEIASYGFHSQAGWITFNVVACGLVLMSRRSTWLSRTVSTAEAPVTVSNPTAAYLVPLLAIIAAGIFSHALSGKFETLYPLRLIACLAMLWRYRHRLRAMKWQWSWRAPVAGLAIFLLWIFSAHFFVRASGMPDPLAAFSPIARGLWIASHVLASILTVPLAEELAYRGYLMRRLHSAEFESVPYAAVGWLPLLVSAIVFGLAHGAMWLPGIAAGLVYGLLLIRKGSLAEPVVAHGVTNGLITIAVLAFGQWQLW